MEEKNNKNQWTKSRIWNAVISALIAFFTALTSAQAAVLVHNTCTL